MTASLLQQELDRLARLEPCHPLLSLYLNTDVDGNGRHTHQVFERKALHEILKEYGDRSAERESLEDDAGRIERYLSEDLTPSTRGLAIFACRRCDVFEAIQLQVPFDRDTASVSDRPQLYPLARVHDQYRRCAALVIDTNTARLFVFSAGETEQYIEIRNAKGRHFKAGGWSQARLQRRTGNEHLHHVKQVVGYLETLVFSEGIERFVVAGDEVSVPIVKEQLPQRLHDRLIDIVRLDIRATEADVREATLAAVRHHDQDAERALVQTVVGDSKAGGRAVVGLEDTRKALRDGQVDTLLIAAAPEQVPGREATADELIAAARQTSAGVRFIDDPQLLQPVGGVAARLRFVTTSGAPGARMAGA
jgi:peptide subunit release factor 1 (eRF1)